MNCTSENHLHLVIPAYREGKRIAPLLHDLARLAPKFAPCSILVVEDGSPTQDRNLTSLAITQIVSDSPQISEPLYLSKNKGKGGAIRAGFNAAPKNTTWLAFIDADGAVSAEEFLRLYQKIQREGNRETSYFASRIMMLGRKIDRKFHRHLAGRIFATIASISLGIRCYDSQCGCKFFPKAIYDQIAPTLRIDGFAFDLELLAFLTDRACPIEELPVNWIEKGESKVNLLRDPLDMLRAIHDISSRRTR